MAKKKGGGNGVGRTKRRAIVRQVSGYSTGEKGALANRGRTLSAEAREAERKTYAWREKNGEFAKYRDPTSAWFGLPLPVDVEMPPDPPRKPTKRL